MENRIGELKFQAGYYILHPGDVAGIALVDSVRPKGIRRFRPRMKFCKEVACQRHRRGIQSPVIE